MFQWMWKRVCFEKRETMADLLFHTAAITFFGISMQAAAYLWILMQSEWYQKIVEKQALQDEFIREKLKMVMGILFVMFLGVWLFCLAAVFIKNNMDIHKMSRQTAFYRIAGYTKGRVVCGLFAGKALGLAIPFVLATAVANPVWHLLCRQEQFRDIIMVLEKGDAIHYRYFYLGICIYAGMIFLSILYMEYGKKGKLAEKLRGE